MPGATGMAQAAHNSRHLLLPIRLPRAPPHRDAPGKDSKAALPSPSIIVQKTKGFADTKYIDIDIYCTLLYNII